jgi:hypothetical protein
MNMCQEQERHLSMLHTIKPFYDNNKKVLTVGFWRSSHLETLQPAPSM